MSEQFWQVAKYTAVHTPEMAIAFLGILLALANARKYPRPALLSFLGCALVLCSGATLFVFLFWYTFSGPSLGWNHEVVMLASFGARSFLTAGGYLLLISAIYTSRKPNAPGASDGFTSGSHRSKWPPFALGSTRQVR